MLVFSSREPRSNDFRKRGCIWVARLVSEILESVPVFGLKKD